MLRDDGSFWLNYGDAYSSGSGDLKNWKAGGGAPVKGIEDNRPDFGLPPKNLMGLPWRVAFALQDDGWILRSAIVWHKCLSGGTWIYARTQKGIGVHMLRDLVRLAPETVHLWNGTKWTRVVSWSLTPRPSNPLELILRSGERIGVTPEHRFPTDKGLLTAADLQVGDTLHSAQLPNGDNTPEWLTDDALWFAGLYLAEGSKSGDKIQLSGHIKETERWERIQRLCAHYGALPSLHVYGNKQNIVISRAHALQAILTMCLSGRTAKDKRLNGIVWGWDNSALRNIVQGYFDGDGHVRPSGIRLGFTRNYHWERDLRTLAARLGARLTLNLSQSTIGGKAYPSFRGEWRWERTYHPNEKNLNEIMAIRKSRARNFYDVSVADEPHLFTLASGIKVHNSNPMPESVRDRPTNAYEMVFEFEPMEGYENIFLFSKQQKYFYDAEAIRTDYSEASLSDKRDNNSATWKYRGNPNGGLVPVGANLGGNSHGGANSRNVWTIPTQGRKEIHFATFPDEIPRRCILAGTSEHGVCADAAASGCAWSLLSIKRIV